MSESDAPQSPPPFQGAGPETQRQRWIKYGSNVVLVCVIVVLLGILLTYLAQQSWAKGRVDTTQMGLYSLKPQTKTILKDLKQNVKIVSLYATVKPPPGKEKDFTDFATPVADLLNEYKRHSDGKIDVEVIDPVQNPAKVDDLIEDVTNRYGGEVKQFREFLDGYSAENKTEDQLKKLLTEEVKQASALPEADLEKSNLGKVIRSGSEFAKTFLEDLEDLKRARKRQLEEKPPNYKRAADGIQSKMEELSVNLAELLKLFAKFKDDKSAPEPVKKYAADSTPRFEAIKKLGDSVSEQVKKLGNLKLDDLRQTLRARDGILVMGPKDMKVVPFEKVWQTDVNLRRQLADPNAEIKPRFAGEQQITSAVLALTQDKKLKVAFVRPGGAPLTQSGGFFGPSGPLSRIANRLRDYNFEVVEKDLSGMWAMQQQMQQRGMPPEPEPSDEEIKDAIWVVLSVPTGPGPMGPPPSIAGKVKEHLAHGGSALCLFLPQSDSLETALSDFGIKVRTDAIVVHEPVPESGATSNDIVEMARRQPAIFVVNNYGDHLLAKPLNSLDMPLLQACPVSVSPKPGYKASTLLPVPSDPKSWGETKVESLSEGGAVQFEADKDIAGPLFVGAAVEKEGGSRVVAIGSVQFVVNDLLDYLDRALLLRERPVPAPRFPGSGELFTNSIFWLARMEPMIAISPAAMEVSRIGAMSEGKAWFWRNGVLLIIMPALVLVAGALMYVRRRD